MKPEVIVCAAIKFRVRDQKDINLIREGRELIIPMVRHYSPDGRDVIDNLNPVFEDIVLNELEQGFITNFSRFVNRKEALEIAKANNQIKHNIGYEPDILFSEMLY